MAKQTARGRTIILKMAKTTITDTSRTTDHVTIGTLRGAPEIGRMTSRTIQGQYGRISDPGIWHFAPAKLTAELTPTVLDDFRRFYGSKGYVEVSPR